MLGGGVHAADGLGILCPLTPNAIVLRSLDRAARGRQFCFRHAWRALSELPPYLRFLHYFLGALGVLAANIFLIRILEISF